MHTKRRDRERDRDREREREKGGERVHSPFQLPRLHQRQHQPDGVMPPPPQPPLVRVQPALARAVHKHAPRQDLEGREAGEATNHLNIVILIILLALTSAR
jgi:hypothetical protein